MMETVEKICMLRSLDSSGNAQAVCGKDLKGMPYVMRHQETTCPDCLEVIHGKANTHDQ